MSGMRTEKGQKKLAKSSETVGGRASLELIPETSFVRPTEPQARKASSLQAAEHRPIQLTPSQNRAVVKGLASFPG